MEKMTVIDLLDKYWQAETTLEEEKALADYFHGPSIDPELESYRELFAYFEEEARVMPNPDLGDRILERLGIAPDQPTAGQASSVRPAVAPGQASTVPPGQAPTVQPGIAPGRPARVILPFGAGLLSAAAVIAALVVGLFLLAPSAQRSPPAPTDAGNALATIRHGTIQDTYDDPEQALAVVRHALLVASTHLNEGRQELTGDHK
jgi:hypothetical protein